MAGRRPYNQGPEKQWMSIVSVNPEKKEIQGTLRDGGKVAVSLFEIPPVFRWPIEGEIWTIEKDKFDSTHWILGSRVHHQQLETEVPVTDRAAGEMRLDASNIYDREGRKLIDQAELNAITPDVGDIKATLRTDAPAKWVLLDGQPVDRITYAALFAIFGTTHNTGGEAVTEFRLPNMKGKTLVHHDAAQVEFETLGDSGGTKTHTLTPGETAMKAHNHGGSTGNDTPDHTHNYGRNLLTDSGVGNANVTTGGNGYQVSAGPSTGRSVVHTHPITAEVAANGTPHANLQPYLVVNYLIYAGV